MDIIIANLAILTIFLTFAGGGFGVIGQFFWPNLKYGLTRKQLKVGHTYNSWVNQPHHQNLKFRTPKYLEIWCEGFMVFCAIVLLFSLFTGARTGIWYMLWSTNIGNSGIPSGVLIVPLMVVATIMEFHQKLEYQFNRVLINAPLVIVALTILHIGNGGDASILYQNHVIFFIFTMYALMGVATIVAFISTWLRFRMEQADFQAQNPTKGFGDYFNLYYYKFSALEIFSLVFFLGCLVFYLFLWGGSSQFNGSGVQFYITNSGYLDWYLVLIAAMVVYALFFMFRKSTPEVRSNGELKARGKWFNTPLMYFPVTATIASVLIIGSYFV